MRNMMALALCALMALCCPHPAAAEVGAPVSLGVAGGEGGLAATLTLTTLAEIPAGALIVVSSKSGDGTGAPGLASAVIEGAAFTLASNVALGSQRLRFAYLIAPTAYPVSTPITLTYTDASSARQAVAAYVTGVVSPTGSAVDHSGSGAQGTSASPSITTGAYAQPEGIVFAQLFINSVGTTVTAEPWTLIDGIVDPDNRRFNLVFAQHASTSAQTYSPTLSSSQQWRVNYIAFKGAASPAAGGGARRGLLGVGK